MSRRTALVGASVALATALVGPLVAPAAATEGRSHVTIAKGVAFVASNQNDDGSFGDGPATETPDAVLAIAEAAQTTLAYDAVAARAAVVAVTKGGRSPLDYLDDLSEQSGLTSGKAAELVLDAVAVGLDPRHFDPQRDGAVDLLGRIDAAHQNNGSYDGTFYFTILSALATRASGGTVDPTTVSYLRAAQRSDGGFNFNGDQGTGDYDGSDTDITGLAVQALVAAGVPGSDAAVRNAVGFLATQQGTDGGFHPSYDVASNPGSTRGAVLAITAAGYAVENACWRAAVGASTSRYVSPDDYLRGAQDASGRIGVDTGFFATQYTAQAVQALVRTFQPIARSERQPCATTGYRLVAADGGVFTHGGSTFEGSTGDRKLNQPIVASAATPTGKGYWLFASDGGVFAFGDAGFYGSTGDIVLNKPIVGAAATPTGGGYWLFASDGGVFAFGDAAFLGSEGGAPLNRPIVAGEASPDGRGYWLYASDGGVFTHGDASFHGSTGDRLLNRPIVAAAASRSGRGYWLFASDGGVFTFGDAAFSGSAGGSPLNQPIVTGFRSGGDGYYLVASDGGVFTYGDAPFLGSEGGGPLNSPIVAATR